MTRRNLSSLADYVPLEECEKTERTREKEGKKRERKREEEKSASNGVPAISRANAKIDFTTVTARSALAPRANKRPLPRQIFPLHALTRDL